MSVAPHAGVIDFGTFTPPTASLDGIQGEVPKPLIGQENYVLTGNGWSSLGALGSITYQGTWDASTNTPTLTSSVGTQGYYYVVSVAGTTDLNGITTWDVGDWAIFNGATWQKVEGGATGTFTNVITPQVTARTDNLTLSAISTGAVKFNTLGGLQAQVSDTSSAINYLQLTGASAGGSPSLTTQGSDSVVSMLLQSKGTGSNIVAKTSGGFYFQNGSGATQLLASNTASAVNYVQVTGAATGVAETQGPLLSAQGSDTDINMRYLTKGAGSHYFSTNTSQIQFKILHAGGNIANRFVVTGSRVNDSPILFCEGTATNISMAFMPKGTGAIDLAAGSSGVNISNGGTVTAITRTNTGSGYTSIPSVAISAPTTAGGVQATATCNGVPSNATVVSGGTGYTVGDVLTLVGGTPVSGAAQLTVATVSSGVITSVTISLANAYSVVPTNPVSVTGGSGTGATFTINYVVAAAFTITNAGSGYIEQPTVTFSGGGGSGAAAFATVGSGTIVKSLHGTMSFNTPAGESVRIQNVGFSTLTDYVELRGGSSVSGAYVTVGGSTANANLYLSSKALANIQFYTNTFNQEQFRVSHTASAVNYVQVTGGATGGRPSISTQGSDGNIGLNFDVKGGPNIFFRSYAGNSVQLKISGTNNSVNNHIISGGASTIAPTISLEGTDTNISMAFQPKGTGAIDLAAGSSGVNISNGGTVTAITRSNAGSGYTSIPSVVISAPTTAGGVQATVTIFMEPIAIAVAGGGTGYTVSDVLTFVGGTIGSQATQVTVTAVSGGVITAVNQTRFGRYSVLPTNPVSVTGGTGTGATFNVTAYALAPEFVITNAGSGYIEQPTITFSGGGGSGAVAYATVGSNTTQKTIGNIHTFATPNSNVLAIVDKNSSGGYPTNATVAFSMIPPQNNFGAAFLGFGAQAYFGTTNTSSSAFVFATSVGSPVTNGGGGPTQLQIAHTASAVNFVQVTGGVTGAAPTITGQGSDGNVPLSFSTKGNSSYRFNSFSLVNTQLRIDGTTASVNFLDVWGSVAGSAPSLRVAGTDTDIGLTLLTKGTGAVNLNTGGGTQFKAIDRPSADVFVQVQGGVGGVSRGSIGTGGTGASGFNIYNSGAIRFQTGGNGVNEQFVIADTASAVNYVQVTGGATGNGASISVQGSDGNAFLAITSKGTSAIRLQTGGSSQVLINNTTSAINQIGLTGSTAGGAPQISTLGTDTNIGLALQSKGTGNITLSTGASTAIQFQVADTASAVNYVQVTGATTGNLAILSSIGSDASVGMELRTKGTPTGPGFRVTNNSGANVCFAVQVSVATPANYIQISPAATGSAPAIVLNGSDTDIDLALNPKGTGKVRYGTYTAGVLTPTGYIEIKDSSGTVRRLLVG